jgi:hypothetical protein
VAVVDPAEVALHMKVVEEMEPQDKEITALPVFLQVAAVAAAEKAVQEVVTQAALLIHLL